MRGAVAILCAGLGLLPVTRISAQVNPGVPWPATDALGRALPLAQSVGLPRTNRFVGIFYFTWQMPGTAIPKSPHWDGPYDVSKILARDPEAGRKPTSPLWGGFGQFHFWGEPLFGYYQVADPWVLRRHVQLLADAGVDVLILDATNGETYPESYLAICAILREVRESGGRTPQIAFMVNTDAGQTAQKLWRDLYQPGLYPELWFKWQGRPLLICDPMEASPEFGAFFTLRRAHWPVSITNTVKAWHWEATYPQPYGFDENPKTPEQVSVSVAQNLSYKDGSVTCMSSGDGRGRSFHGGNQSISPGSVNFGHNFQEQWNRALDLDAPFVLVTSWNEWIAGRWGVHFMDQYDQEFSRDVEPMKGGHSDNYYWQMIANIRRYKGAPSLPAAANPKRICLDSGFAQWRDVPFEYRDHIGETKPRAYPGVGGTSYTNNTGRNDFCTLKAAHDDTMVYFYVRTVHAVTPRSGTNWMWLMIDVDQNPATGWAGYDFIVNRSVAPNGQAWLEKNSGGWQWEKVAPVEVKVEGNELQLALPRSALGMPAGETTCRFDFKWADNLSQPGEIMDFYLSGDVAPEGRFNFRYAGQQNAISLR